MKGPGDRDVGHRQVWVEDRMAELLRSADDRLSAPAEVLFERIASRTTNDRGKAPAERELIVQHLATVEPLLRASCTHELDASRPLAEVVADLIEIARQG